MVRRMSLLGLAFTTCIALAGIAVATGPTESTAEVTATESAVSIAQDARACAAERAVPTTFESEFARLAEASAFGLQICIEPGDCPGPGACADTCASCEQQTDCSPSPLIEPCVYPPDPCR